MRKTVIAAAMLAFTLTANALSLVDWVRQESHGAMSHNEATRIVYAAKKVAADNQLDLVLVLAIMKQESGFRIAITSGHGAQGIMQVIPRWHREKVKGRSLHTLEVGSEVGAAVLAEYLKDVRGDTRRALRKYSGGSQTYANSVLAYRARMILETHDGLVAIGD